MFKLLNWLMSRTILTLDDRRKMTLDDSGVPRFAVSYETRTYVWHGQKVSRE